MPATAERATQTFDEIAPVVMKYARKCLRSSELENMALVLAWYRWHLASEEKRTLPASVWARVGVRHALADRDIPGIRSKFRDAMKHMETQGAGMNGLADHRPGPERVVMAREEWEKFSASFSEYDQEMCELLTDGHPNQEVARRMRRTPGAISQRRRQLMERFRDQ